MPKLPPCCARRVGAITREKANLATLARKASIAEARGYSTEKFKRLIAEGKANVKEAEDSLADHEAEHAGEVA